MSELKGLRVVVAGAGAVGSVLALALAREGARVTLADPAPAGDNASGVAAGMLAPASEALLDPKSAGHYPLFKAGRGGWVAVLEGLSDAPPIDRSGALIKVGGYLATESVLDQGLALGAAIEPLTDQAAMRMAPGLDAEGPFLFTPDDWRLEPHAMLAALHEAFRAAGGQRLSHAAVGIENGQARLQGAQSIPADVLVMATGLVGGGLMPIKGQILRFPGFGPATGPVVRGGGVYVAPSAQGAIVGATMEEGLSDLAIDDQAVQRLRAAAALLVPALTTAPFQAFAGVRAATPDGLPLVGPDGQGGLFVARGARRNGWLLAPLIAEVAIGHLTGKAPSAAAKAFDPARFR